MKADKSLGHINIRLGGTWRDVRLLRRIFKAYLKTANATEKFHIEDYLSLIDYNVKCAAENVAAQRAAKEAAQKRAAKDAQSCATSSTAENSQGTEKRSVP